MSTLVNVVIFVNEVPVVKKFEIEDCEYIKSLVFRKSTDLTSDEYLDELNLSNCENLSGDFIMPECVKKCEIHDCAFTSFKYDGIYIEEGRTLDDYDLNTYTITLYNLYECKNIDLNTAINPILNPENDPMPFIRLFTELESLKITNSLTQIDSIGSYDGEDDIDNELKVFNLSGSTTGRRLIISIWSLENLETINLSDCSNIQKLMFEEYAGIDPETKFNLYFINEGEYELKYLYLDGTDLGYTDGDVDYNGCVKINNSNLVELTLPYDLKRAEIKYNNYLRNITFDNISYESEPHKFDIYYNMNLRSINGKSTIEGILKKLMNLDEPITVYDNMNYNFTMNAFRSASKPKNIGITPQIIGWNGNSGEIYGDPVNKIEDEYSDQFILIADQNMEKSLSFLLKNITIWKPGNYEKISTGDGDKFSNSLSLFFEYDENGNILDDSAYIKDDKKLLEVIYEMFYDETINKPSVIYTNSSKLKEMADEYGIPVKMLYLPRKNVFKIILVTDN